MKTAVASTSLLWLASLGGATAFVVLPPSKAGSSFAHGSAGAVASSYNAPLAAVGRARYIYIYGLRLFVRERASELFTCSLLLLLLQSVAWARLQGSVAKTGHHHHRDYLCRSR